METIQDFPTLIGESSIGKPKMWKICVIKDIHSVNTGTIRTTHGYEGCKMQTIDKEITSGKNIGRINETTPFQQAIQEARTQWMKKRDSGYIAQTILPDCLHGSRVKETTENIPAPMLAHDYNKRGKSIEFPCYIQRKYDGTRCIAIPGIGMYSRNKKKYPHLEHILDEIKILPSSIVLDGELYSGDLTFQEIIGIVKRETQHSGDNITQLKIQFHVYDIISDAPFEDRYARLLGLFAKFKFKYLTLVISDTCISHKDLKIKHDKYVSEGFEGAILRNRKGLYKVGYRTVDLQKYKEFIDDEYEIIGFKEGEGLDTGCVVWKCITHGGKEFSCRPRGTKEERSKLFQAGSSYIGKKLTVRFQELNDDGVPRFPVGIIVRDYE